MRLILLPSLPEGEHNGVGINGDIDPPPSLLEPKMLRKRVSSANWPPQRPLLFAAQILCFYICNQLQHFQPVFITSISQWLPSILSG